MDVRAGRSEGKPPGTAGERAPERDLPGLGSGAGRIAIVGTGHVGLVTGAGFAELGHQVCCVDSNAEKIAALVRGEVPFYEPGLRELVQRHHGRRLMFTTDLAGAVRQAQVIFITVGTPTRPDGESDLSAVERVAQEIGLAMPDYRLIVEKSTVPVETGEWVRKTIAAHVRPGVTFDVASNPEFLREGSAVEDVRHPDRVVLGVESDRARELLLALYQPLHAPIVITDIPTAELIKHACNSFLATKVSFINAVSHLCEQVGADVTKVAEAMELDQRIGRGFLHAGIGYGGSCFPKDVAAFITVAEKRGVPFDLLRAVRRINEDQRTRFVKKVRDLLWNLQGKTIGALGLAFKPETDDMRESPAAAVIRALVEQGAQVKAYDPQAEGEAAKVLKGVTFCRGVEEAARGSDCLVLLTEWPEFRHLDFRRLKDLMKTPVIVDGRNLYDPEELVALGFKYAGVGRRTVA